MNKLLNLLCKIPSGKVTTYKELAKKLKIHPRTVGILLNKNLYPIVFPCHRVVMSNGSLGGYSKGITKKAQLLRSEGIQIRNGKINLKKYLYKF